MIEASAGVVAVHVCGLRRSARSVVIATSSIMVKTWSDGSATDHSCLRAER